MGLCSCDMDNDYEWYWEKLGEPKLFNLKRRKHCLNCKELIEINTECQEFGRIAHDEDGNEKHLSSSFLCENCSDLTLAIEELNGCYTLGGKSLKEQISDANDDL